MPRGQRGGGIRLAHDDEEDDLDRFRFPTTFHALISWPRFAKRVMERLDAFDRRFTQIHSDSLRSSNSMARIQADQATQQSRIHSLSVAQAKMGSVLSEMRTDIATSEERVLQSIDSLTQLFRRRFPSPSVDP
ncbi:hypothetical protein Dimus_008573 [Dionaea muscipula]